MKKLRAAIIGAGQVASVSHIPNYQRMEDVELVGICDTNLEAAKKLAAQFNIPGGYKDHMQMLSELKPDLVSVCVPNTFHARITMDALRAGCHVLCEKPPAISLKEAKEMEQTAKEANRLLTYGFHMRHGTQVALIKEKLKQGELGVVYGAKAIWLRRRGIPGWGSFTNREMQGGGPLIDLGAHVLDTALYLLDYPEVAYVCADAYDYIGKAGGNGLFGKWEGGRRYTVEDGLFGYIHFQNGVSLRLETSFALHMREKDIKSVQIFGDRAGAELFPLEIYGMEDGCPVDRKFPFFPEEDLHKKELEQFVRACQGKEPLLVKAEEGMYLQNILDMLYLSAGTKAPVISTSL